MVKSEIKIKQRKNNISILENKIGKKIQLTKGPKKNRRMRTKTLNKKIKGQITFIDSRVKLKISKHFTKKIKRKTQNQKKDEQI